MSMKRQPVRIDDILSGVLSESGYLTVCKEFDVVAKWPQIVGDQISEVSECTRVDKGILYVRIQSSSWRQEISYLKGRILAKIRAETKCTTISDIVFY